MSLKVGEHLGTYKIVGHLGAGGMGEVYRATDTKLDREVALKVLPDAMDGNPERVARFEREAKLLASLNHPQIAVIYGFEQAEGKRFLALKLVEGPTLEERIAAGPLMVEESLDIARQIAEALEAAHEKGIIHRDLKPANVKSTPEGQVKVLDFGLAKALAEEDPDTEMSPTSSPTITEHFTKPGVILGTAAYMSPEQARGRPVDRRSDIWSFGCVLYECLTGDSMFRGETVTDSIGAILHKQPDWERLPAETPPTIQLLLRRCLAKDRKRRLRDIGDARIELEAAIADPTSSSIGLASASLAADIKSPRRALPFLATAATSILLTVIFMLGIEWVRWPEPPLRKLRPNLTDATLNDLRNPATISPNGKRIVYVRDNRLWVQDLDHLTPRELPGTDSARYPFWSPDSETVGYCSRRQLWLVDVVGGSPSALARSPGPIDATGDGGITWLSDGRILFCGGLPRAAGLWEVSAAGGTPHLILQPKEGECDFETLGSLPDGHGVLFVADTTAGPADTISVYADGERRTVLTLEGEDLASPVYSNSGHILFQRGATSPSIWAVGFSLDRLEAKEEKPFKVADGLAPSVSDDGTLLYLSGISPRACRLVWIDEAGQLEPIVTRDQLMSGAPSLSPDESRALVTVVDDHTDSASIWMHDLDTGRANRVTFPPRGMVDYGGEWHPDGKHIVFCRRDTRSGDLRTKAIMMRRVDGTGEAIEMVDGGSWFSLSKDGRYLAYECDQREDGQDGDIAYISLKEDGQPQFLRSSPATELKPAISPKGSLLAYTSDESGQLETYLTKFPSGERRWLVSLGHGGWVKSWARDQACEVLYYIAERRFLYRVTVKFNDGDEEPEIGEPEKLLDLDPHDLPGPGLVATRDGKRFLAVQRVDAAQGEKTNVVLVENWFSEFKNRESE